MLRTTHAHPRVSCPVTVYNNGYVYLTVNNFTASAYYSGADVGGSTAQSVAAALASQLNVANSPVAATANLSSIILTAISGGASTDYSFSSSGTYNHSGCPSNQCFLAPAFSVSPTTGALSGGTGGLSSSPLVTTYTYDAVGNLTGSLQGVQARTYQYDALSRITLEKTPEASTTTNGVTTQNPTTWSYVANGGALCSGNPSNPCIKTDGRGIITTYSYDGANRLIGKTHNPSTTGAESYTYGTSATAYNVGRLLTMTDPSGSETYTYDQIGRVTKLTKTIGTTTYTTSYAYNAGGQLVQITYPSGRNVYNVYDNVGHLCLVASASATTCSSTSPYLTIQSGNYDAASRPLKATYGNGVVATAAYDPKRSTLTSLSYAMGTTTLFGLNYYYGYDKTNCSGANPIGNNGQIQCISDTVQSGRTGA